MTVAANDDRRGARALAERALAWWLSELGATWREIAGRAAIGTRNDIVLEAGERYWILRQRQRPLGQIDLTLSDTDETQLDLRRMLGARRGIVVEIPPERALSKRIVLPAVAKSEIPRILRFEIARHFPFPADRVFFQHRIVAGSEAARGAIEVEIVAVPREIVTEVLDALRGAGVRPRAVIVGGAEPVRLPVASAGTPELGRDDWGLILLLAALVVAALASPILHDRLRLAGIERDIAALEPRVQAILAARERQQSAAAQTAAPLRLAAARPPLVAVLDDLTKAVPDGSWLLSLTLSGNELVIDGLSPSAATLALALEKSRSFAKVAFRAPIARDPVTGLEHFRLSATVSGGKP